MIHDIFIQLNLTYLHTLVFFKYQTHSIIIIKTSYKNVKSVNKDFFLLESEQ